VKAIRVCQSVAIATAVAACSPGVPTGQVLAQVGDVAITRRDLAVELTASGFGADVDPATRQAVLGKLVERALLVRQARERRIDRSPEYLAALRRERDLLQLSQLAKQAAGRQPRPRDVEAFVVGRPWMFAQREIVTAEALLITRGAAPTLDGEPSLDRAAGQLSAMRVPFQRRIVRIDTALLVPESARQLLAAKPDDVRQLQLDNRPALVRLISRTPAAIDGARALSVARAVMRQRNVNTVMAKLLGDERRRTPVTYQQGFGPGS
jgi:hypothetical protein